MKRFLAVFFVLFFLSGTACKGEVRRPAVTGAFYPADPAGLSKAVDGYLSAAKKDGRRGELCFLIAPHAGYEFSGGVAGAAFKQVTGERYDTVIIMGPSHRFPFQGASVYLGDAFSTPLGEVEVDKALARSFLDDKAKVGSDPRAHSAEHSIEVELPFLQRALKPGFRIVPIVVGDLTRETADSLSGSLVRVLDDGSRKTLVVVSTDWSHYHDYDTAVKMDTAGIQTVSKLSSFELLGRAGRGEVELCGIYPAAVALDAANRSGADTARLFMYANSGDVTGDRGRVVGYAAMGVYRKGGAAEGALTKAQKKVLIKLARDTVVSFVETGGIPDAKTDDPALSVPRGVFVTLKKNGELRGCIGGFYADGPLTGTVSEMAVSACSRDFRFNPVTKDELKDIKVEISVLSPLWRIRRTEDVKVGRDGLYIMKDGRSGVLLPQVPVEWGWDRDTFLAETCRKAGLPRDAWRQGADIYVFTADVFGEE